MSYSKADRAFNGLKTEYLDVYSDFIVSPLEISTDKLESLEELAVFWLRYTNNNVVSLPQITSPASFLGKVGHLIEQEEDLQRKQLEKDNENIFQRAWRAWMSSLLLIQAPIIVFTILGFAAGVIIGQIHALNYVNNDLIEHGVKGFHYSKF